MRIRFICVQLWISSNFFSFRIFSETLDKIPEMPHDIWCNESIFSINYIFLIKKNLKNIPTLTFFLTTKINIFKTPSDFFSVHIFKVCYKLFFMLYEVRTKCSCSFDRLVTLIMCQVAQWSPCLARYFINLSIKSHQQEIKNLVFN